jgi:hypothetical protein
MRSKAMGVKSNNENQPILTMKKLDIFNLGSACAGITTLGADPSPGG